MDANILEKIGGKEIRLYDLSLKANMVKVEKGLLEDYFYPGMNRKKVFDLMTYRFKNR